MASTERILLIDDGELAEVAAMLDRLRIPHTRLKGGDIEGELAPPTDLLIATPRRASAVRRGSPSTAGRYRPLRIIAVDEDSTAMRRVLRRMGFNLLVRRGAHPEVWRLLIERALFEGDERRTDPRVPVGATISVTSWGPENGAECHDSDDSLSRATLIDISNRGCRLSTSELLDPGVRLSIEIPLVDASTDRLQLRGRIVRTTMEGDQAAGERYTAGMLFDMGLEEDRRLQLSRLLNDLSVGPGSVPDLTGEQLPACDSPDIPGLTLDAETDPALNAGVEISLHRRVGPTPEIASELQSQLVAADRRQTPRGSFGGQVLALSPDAREQPTRVLMGRDLSAGGMRIERMPDLETGDRFRLAIYGPASQHPFLVDAVVHRDDGEDGIALRFVDVSLEVARGLEKLVACLPDVESLEDGEASALGAVISEIVARTGRR